MKLEQYYNGLFEISWLLSYYKHIVDGVICGHFHYAHVCEIEGVTYYNDGDWVESCTALVEDHAGELHLINWFDSQKLPDAKPTPLDKAIP